MPNLRMWWSLDLLWGLFGHYIQRRNRSSYPSIFIRFLSLTGTNPPTGKQSDQRVTKVRSTR